MFMDWKTLYCYNIKTPRETYSFNVLSAAAAAKLLQSCPTLCDPIDGGPPGSPVPGILQARTLEWVAISFSNAWKWKVKVKSLSPVRLFATPWTAAFQAPPSMGFSRQEYWSGVPLPSPEPLPLCLWISSGNCTATFLTSFPYLTWNVFSLTVYLRVLRLLVGHNILCDLFFPSLSV